MVSLQGYSFWGLTARIRLKLKYHPMIFGFSKTNIFIIVTGQNINYQRIEQAITYLQQNFHRQPALDEVAEQVHISPFHFQRIFTEWAGISPKRFLQFLTADFLKEKIRETRNLMDAAEAAGLSGQSRVYDLFTTLEAVTPQQYKTNGAGISIQFGFHETPFGLCLLGLTERGICWLAFVKEDEEKIAMEAMKSHWNNSVFHSDQKLTLTYIDKIFPHPYPKERKAWSEGKLHLLVKGTNFQVKVWEALMRLPCGSVTTYQHIAASIQNPKALQAVGSAVGANHIAYLIPCHRVIRKDGVLGEYRWGSARKKSMIGREMANASIY